MRERTTLLKSANLPKRQVIPRTLMSAQKQEIIERVTDAVVAVEGEGLRPVTWVIIEDVPTGAWGVGGQIVTGQDLKKMAAQPVEQG